MRRYEAVLELDPGHAGALKGQDRIYNRTGRYKELLDNLARQVDVAASPRQRINLYERISGLEEEEFLEHAKAIAAREAILAIEPTNDAALTALARLYRGLGRWEEVVRVLDRHATLVEATRPRKTGARPSPALASWPTSSARRIARCRPTRRPSVSRPTTRRRSRPSPASARRRATRKPRSPPSKRSPGKRGPRKAKAEQWIRAARLLEGRGDKDGAIVRYKLALEGDAARREHLPGVATGV